MNPELSNDCNWPGSDQLMRRYHDEEWGVPLHNDQKIFEFMVLDAFQAGLSWKTVLHKRENFGRAFDNFNYCLIAEYTEEKIQELMQDVSIIRNQAKIRTTVTNAKAFIKVQLEFGSFDHYIWQFTGGKTIENQFSFSHEIPARSAESDAMSKDLTSRGFKFVGSTICYAFMQAAGMVNDHLLTCSKRRV
ncbi:MAG: DNA-3-methyladenine glycosylase I [Paludibacter sp.]|nr:DNA-3-methyladenine glycosylase I [Paludibacter sp.]